MTTKKVKHAGGRPTDYRPEYCEQAIKWGKLGKSKAWICAEFDCTPQTMANWCAANPEFLEAITIAVTHSQRWWEDSGQGGLKAKTFNGSLWARNVTSRFTDWQEKNTTTLQGPDGKPLNTAPTIIFTGSPAGASPPEAVGGTSKPGE